MCELLEPKAVSNLRLAKFDLISAHAKVGNNIFPVQIPYTIIDGKQVCKNYYKILGDDAPPYFQESSTIQLKTDNIRFTRLPHPSGTPGWNINVETDLTGEKFIYYNVATKSPIIYYAVHKVNIGWCMIESNKINNIGKEEEIFEEEFNYSKDKYRGLDNVAEAHEEEMNKHMRSWLAQETIRGGNRKSNRRRKYNRRRKSNRRRMSIRRRLR